MDLANKKCKPCEGGVKPFSRSEADPYLKVVPGWSLGDDGKSIYRRYAFPNFKKALAFVNTVGDIAESEGHHPDIELGWGKVIIHLSTHSI